MKFNAAVRDGILDTPMPDWLTFGMRVSAAVGFPVEAEISHDVTEARVFDTRLKIDLLFINFSAFTLLK